MRQQTLAGTGFERFRKRTRRETFLLEMEQIIPWRDLCKVIKPFYPKVKRKGAGRPPVGLERMLRIHFLQHWFNLSDPAVEEALYDSRAMRSFVGIDTWVASRHRMKRRFASFDICWRPTTWAIVCSS